MIGITIEISSLNKRSDRPGPGWEASPTLRARRPYLAFSLRPVRAGLEWNSVFATPQLSNSATPQLSKLGSQQLFHSRPFLVPSVSLGPTPNPDLFPCPAWVRGLSLVSLEPGRPHTMYQCGSTIKHVEKKRNNKDTNAGVSCRNLRTSRRSVSSPASASPRISSIAAPEWAWQLRQLDAARSVAASCPCHCP